MRATSDLLETAAEAAGARSPDALVERVTALQDELREAKRRLKAGARRGSRSPVNWPAPRRR